MFLGFSHQSSLDQAAWFSTRLWLDQSGCGALTALDSILCFGSLNWTVSIYRHGTVSDYVSIMFHEAFDVSVSFSRHGPLGGYDSIRIIGSLHNYVSIHRHGSLNQYVSISSCGALGFIVSLLHMGNAQAVMVRLMNMVQFNFDVSFCCLVLTS